MYRIGIIGLGYVGLPLSVAFAKEFEVIGYDQSVTRVQELLSNYDKTLEVSSEELSESRLRITCDFSDLCDCNVYVVTVPTPITESKQPDLSALIKATACVGKTLSENDIVIYESTVYPGCTEEVCVPILEKHSGLKFNKNFFCGYSPERVNPGDKNKRVSDIVKVTSGSTVEVAETVDQIYQRIISAGTYKAESIKVAEAAKVIENAQRDINIAFVNELALIFNKLGVDTYQVLKAAGTKWNFLPFWPGLVGGHCIGVDPFYLTHKAEAIGYHPEVILSGRRINDSMGGYVASRVIKLLIKKERQVSSAKVLLLGATFKENCPDVRNSKVCDVASELDEFGAKVFIHDPWASNEDIQDYFGLENTPLSQIYEQDYDAVIFAVAHDAFMEIDLSRLKRSGCIIFDVKGVLDRNMVDGRL